MSVLKLFCALTLASDYRYSVQKKEWIGKLHVHSNQNLYYVERYDL